MNIRPNAAKTGRVDFKTSPAAKNVKIETESIAGKQTDSTQRDKGARFSSLGSTAEQSRAKNAAVENNAKTAPAAPDESASSAPETALLQKEKKFSGRCRLFVGNLPNDLSENEFQKFFEPFGELNELFLNASRGFGFLRLVSILWVRQYPDITQNTGLTKYRVGRVDRVDLQNTASTAYVPPHHTASVASTAYFPHRQQRVLLLMYFQIPTAIDVDIIKIAAVDAIVSTS